MTLYFLDWSDERLAAAVIAILFLYPIPGLLARRRRGAR